MVSDTTSISGYLIGKLKNSLRDSQYKHLKKKNN